jgi:hypothetical protein
VNHEEQSAILRDAVASLDALETKIDGIFGTGWRERQKATWRQIERQRLTLDAIVRLRRQVAQLHAEISLGPISDYTKPNPFPRQPKKAHPGQVGSAGATMG